MPNENSMDFLKEVFGDGALTLDELIAKAQEKNLKIANLAGGEYVSKAKYDDEINEQKRQVAEREQQIAKRDADIADIQSKLASAQEDGNKLKEAQDALALATQQYNADKAKWEEATYDYALSGKCADVKFTSAAAKRDFKRSVKEQKIVYKDGNFEGYDEFLQKYIEENPGAVAKDEPAEPKTPTITIKTGSKAKQAKSLSELMELKNKNPNMEIKYE